MADADAFAAHVREAVQDIISPAFSRSGLDLVSEAIDHVAWIDFTEIRAALQPRVTDPTPATSFALMTPAEIDAASSLGSRDYLTFFTNLKTSVLAGVWRFLVSLLDTSDLIARTPGTLEPDAAACIVYRVTEDAEIGRRGARAVLSS